MSQSPVLRPTKGRALLRGVSASILTNLVILAGAVSAEDPWPFWQRTSTRLGQTETVGPRTPTIAWSVQISFHWSESILESSCVMDNAGRVYLGHHDGITVTSPVTREVLWEVTGRDYVQGTPVVWGGYVMWGDVSPSATFYCFDTRTGRETWSEGGHFITASPVVGPGGTVYFVDQQGFVSARRVADGSEVWTKEVAGSILSSPTLRNSDLLVSASGLAGAHLDGLDPPSGAWRWTAFAGREVYGTQPLHNDRVYHASGDWNLYCFDAKSGEELWRVGPISIMRGGVAIGHDDTVYALTGGGEGVGRLIAASPDGDFLWEYPHLGQALNAPIVGGDGTIYFCSQATSPERGRVHAVRSDGTELWIKDMPRHVSASPMLAPDGTLYVVCRDKFLYAFRDPPGDLDFDGDIDLDDFARLEGCLTGPRLWGQAAKTAPGCELLDFDSDWDVDLTDLGRFQLAFTGPK